MDLVCLKLIRWQCSISEVRNDFVHPLRISYYLTDGFGNVNTRTWQEFQGNTPVRDEHKRRGDFVIVQLSLHDKMSLLHVGRMHLDLMIPREGVHEIKKLMFGGCINNQINF